MARPGADRETGSSLHGRWQKASAAASRVTGAPWSSSEAALLLIFHRGMATSPTTQGLRLQICEKSCYDTNVFLLFVPSWMMGV